MKAICGQCESEFRALLEGDWSDREDELTQAVRADFRSDGFFERYARAMDLVGNRHSKGALVALVTYLLREHAPVKKRPSD